MFSFCFAGHIIGRKSSDLLIWQDLERLGCWTWAAASSCPKLCSEEWWILTFLLHLGWSQPTLSPLGSLNICKNYHSWPQTTFYPTSDLPTSMSAAPANRIPDLSLQNTFLFVYPSASRWHCLSFLPQGSCNPWLLSNLKVPGQVLFSKQNWMGRIQPLQLLNGWQELRAWNTQFHP